VERVLGDARALPQGSINYWCARGGGAAICVPYPETDPIRWLRGLDLDFVTFSTRRG
jgi:hypothetical protein